MFDQFYYFFICVFIFAIGDFLGVLTRARLSAVFVALILFLTGFMTGVIPKNVINLAGLTEFGRLSAALIIFHMGSNIASLLVFIFLWSFRIYSYFDELIYLFL